MMKHPSLLEQEHRPWPIPTSPWKMAQRWSELLFAHWPVEEASLRSLIPEPLEVDTYGGSGWIGVVPFYLHVRPRFAPYLPLVGAFPEINVRTYVTFDGKPGVWFFSLDATSRLAVRVARLAFGLPYFDAEISLSRTKAQVQYSSHRTGMAASQSNAEFHGTYQPVSEVFLAEAGTRDAWLTERYCLYAAGKNGSLYRTDVHHRPWPLQKAEGNFSSNTMTSPIGIELNGEPVLHYSKSIEVVNWLPERVV